MSQKCDMTSKIVYIEVQSMNSILQMNHSVELKGRMILIDVSLNRFLSAVYIQVSKISKL